MTGIQTGSTPLTLINVFAVAPERQGVLIAHLQNAPHTSGDTSGSPVAAA